MSELPKKRNKLLLTLSAATGVALLLLIGFLVGSLSSERPPKKPTDGDNPTIVLKTGQSENSNQMASMPGRPPAVNNPERLRENLKQGKTYVLRCSLKFDMEGTHNDYWIVNTRVKISYAARATIHRKIIENDGHKVVEDREFKEVKALALETKLDSVTVSLGFVGDAAEILAARVIPDKVPFVAGGRRILESVNLARLADLFGWNDSVKNHLLQQNAIKMLTYAGHLAGKIVRLEYTDSDRNVKVTPLQGNELGQGLSEEEKRFLAASVLPLDSLLFPNVNVKVGDRWPVDGPVLTGLFDPTLLATTKGTITLERGEDEGNGADRRALIRVIGGQLEFNESTPQADSIGSFQTQRGNGGELKFSLKDKIFVLGRLVGQGHLNIRHKGHILFGARTTGYPRLEIEFAGRLLETPD